MRLWRIAGKDGKGFYFSELPTGKTISSTVEAMINRDISSMTEQHPRPSDDGIREFHDHHFFAFSSLDQLHDWFDKEMFAATCKAGGLMEIWEVDGRHVKFGRKQVAFEKKKATRVEVVRLDQFKRR